MRDNENHCCCHCSCQERTYRPFARPELPPAKVVKLDEDRGFISVRKALFGRKFKIAMMGKDGLIQRLYSEREIRLLIRALEESLSA